MALSLIPYLSEFVKTADSMVRLFSIGSSLIGNIVQCCRSLESQSLTFNFVVFQAWVRSEAGRKELQTRTLMAPTDLLVELKLPLRTKDLGIKLLESPLLKNGYCG
jgi:hypothetical protein